MPEIRPEIDCSMLHSHAFSVSVLGPPLWGQEDARPKGEP